MARHQAEQKEVINRTFRLIAKNDGLHSGVTLSLFTLGESECVSP
jgi:hypothetical protein